jgi:hypothetical protein
MKRFFVGIIVALGLAACSYSNDWQTAEKYAGAFSAKMFPGKVAQVECAHLDTDLNGYCSCTVLTGNRPQAVECGCPRIYGLFHLKSWFDPKTELLGCRLDRAINRTMNIGMDESDAGGAE